MRKTSMHLIFKKENGFTLIELMVAITLATMMSLGVLSIYVNQSGTISSEIQRDTTAQAAHQAFDSVSRLLRHAEQNSILISYGTGKKYNTNDEQEITNDAISVKFTLPANQDIWPNTHIDNATDKNAIQLKWHNGTDPSPYQIQISNASSIGELGSANVKILAGSDKGSLARVINLDVWPLLSLSEKQASVTGDANSGYFLRVTTRASEPDFTYNDGTDGTYKNYRTYTVSGVVAPRN